MRLLIFAILFSLIPAEARWLNIKEAGSVISKYDLDYQILKDGNWIETTEIAIRVQAEDGKSTASLYPIEYNAATDQVEILEAYTMNGRTRLNVEASAIEDRDRGEAKDYDAMKVRSVVFPQVQIGSVVHIKYRLRTTRPLLEGRWSDDLTVAPGMFVERFHLQLKSEVPLNFEINDPNGYLKVQQRSPNSLVITGRKIFPGWIQAEKDPFFHPKQFSRMWISTHKEWPEFMRPLTRDFDQIVSAPLPAKMKVWVQQSAKKATNREKILDLMERMSREFRYFGDWRRHNGGLVPRSLAEIEKSRYGDCKDLSSLLTAMVRQLGLKADVALVRRGGNPWGEEPNYILPSTNRFNHAIVRVIAEDKTLWLDPTNPVSTTDPLPDVAGRPAWIMEGEGHFERIPAAKAEMFQHVSTYEYDFRSEETVGVRVKTEMTGLAPYHLSNSLLSSPRADVLTEALEFLSEGHEVRSYNYVREPEANRVLRDLKIDLAYEAGSVTFRAGKASFFVIPDGVVQGPFYETQGRVSDLRLSDNPFLFKGTRRLKNTRLAQDLPPPCRVDSPWLTLERRVEVHERDVLIIQQMNLKQPFITQSEFGTPEFLRLQTETRRCFHRAGILIEPMNRPLSMTDQ